MFPGYRLDFRGEFDQIQESFADLVQLFVIGVFLIYVILATQFKSFLQPSYYSLGGAIWNHRRDDWTLGSWCNIKHDSYVWHCSACRNRG